MDYLKVLVIIGMVSGVFSADQTLTYENVNVQVLEQSGKMKMWQQVNSSELLDQNSTASVAKPITIFLNSLKEIDKDGNEVGKTGKIKHYFKNFASQDFNVTAPDSGKIPNSNISAAFLEFDCQLSGLSTRVKLVVYIAKEDGNYTLGNTSVEVKKGMVKFSVEVSNWDWCTTGCKKGNSLEIGAFVDLELTIQLSGSQTVKEETDDDDKNVKEFDFGEEQNMETPTIISIDNVYKTFPAGFPKFELKNNTNLFTFRLEKFNTSALYDPTINLGHQTGEDEKDEEGDEEGKEEEKEEEKEDEKEEEKEKNSAETVFASLLTIMLGMIAVSICHL